MNFNCSRIGANRSKPRVQLFSDKIAVEIIKCTEKYFVDFALSFRGKEVTDKVEPRTGACYWREEGHNDVMKC